MALSGVIYMHRISDFRMGGISRRNFSMFRKLCGDDSLKNVLIVTNMWGEVDPAVGAAREAELRDKDLFFKPVLDKRAQLLRHDRTIQSAHAIISKIIGNHPAPLRIQEELVDQRMDISQTAAGTELNRELAEQAKKHMEELRQIREEMKHAIKEKDEETRQELDAEATKLKEEMRRIQLDSQKLEANYNAEKSRMEQRMLDIAEAAQRTAEQYQQQMNELNRQLEERAQTSYAERNAIQKQMDDLQRKYEADVRNNGGCTIL